MKKIKSHKGENSFSLLELMFATILLTMMATTFYKSFSRSALLSVTARQRTKALWLGKAIMAQIEYQSTFLDLKTMKYDKKDQKFPESLCPKDDCIYKYNLKVQPWKLDLVSILLNRWGPTH